jgi:CcmD family protein
LDDLTYLLIGYMVIWLGLFGYTIYLHLKQIKLTRDIDLLEETVRSYAKKKKEQKRRNKK